MSATIPGLPPELRDVPGPIGPDDREGADAWRAWYARVLRHRVRVAALCEDDPEARALVRRLCRADPAYFVCLFGWIYEPRTREGKAAGDMPFVPYAFQVELFRWLERRMGSTGLAGNGVVSKSRDMGATWCVCAYALWGWLFGAPFSAHLVSRKEDLVDKPRDQNSMFYKIDFMLSRLPGWLKPEGFARKDHRLKMLLKHPTTENAITGESTTANTGRAARSQLVVVDEAAFVENLNLVLGSLQATSDHVLAVSSESVQHGMDFSDLLRLTKEEAPDACLELDYWRHPDHDAHWVADMRRRFVHDPEAFEREIMRNPLAGFGEWVYPYAQKIVCGNYPYEPYPHPLYVGIDPGYDDDTAILWLQFDPATGRYRLVEAYWNSHKPAAFYGNILTGRQESSAAWSYTAEDLRIMEWTRTLQGWKILYFGDPYGSHSQGATGESFYDILGRYNVRVLYGNKNEMRYHKGRREAMAALLPQIDFHDTPNVRRALHAFQHYRFETQDGNRASEQKTPLHDRSSHFVTAGEFVAVNLRELRGVYERPPLGPGPRATYGAREERTPAWASH